METSTFVTDAELTGYLNTALADLWGRLVLNQSQPFYRSQTTIDVVLGQNLYPLPADFLTLQEVTATLGGVTGSLRPFMPAEHGPLSSLPARLSSVPTLYRVQGDNIEFQPVTQAFTATVYYSPCQPVLDDPSDTFDGFNGWELAAIYDVCATVAAKEESDPSFFLAQRDRMYAQIDRLAAYRDMANPERVQDVELLDLWSAGSIGWE